MNERIRELAEQCVGDRPYNNSFDYEKFADLIILECLLSLEPDPMASEIDYDVELKFYQRSAKKIKRHFGLNNDY